MKRVCSFVLSTAGARLPTLTPFIRGVRASRAVNPPLSARAAPVSDESPTGTPIKRIIAQQQRATGPSRESAKQKGTRMSTTAWIIIAIVVVVVVAVLAFVFMNRRSTARRARAEKIRQEATERAAELDRKEAEANAMAAQAQDARAEADRLESVSAQERERTAEARTDVEDALRKADRLDPDPGGRRAADAVPRRATHDASAEGVASERGVVEDDVRGSGRDVRDEGVRDDMGRDDVPRDEVRRDDVTDPAVEEGDPGPRRSSR